jgi:histidine triad (HIT) family protein
LAFKDVAPVTPVHFLVIPKDKKGLTTLSKATDEHKELLGHLMVVAGKVATEQGLEEGWRLVVNNGVHGCKK